MSQTLEIDVVSDPACPWCLLGIARLDKAVAALPDDVDVAITHHPFLLDADAPMEGENVVEMLTRKYGREPYDSWDRLEAEANASGLPLDMRKQTMRYASQPAEALIAVARDKGTQHELARALSHAYYLDARNIADPEVLADVAGDHGFSPEEVREIVTSPDLIKAVEQVAVSVSQQGITGVPFFIFNKRYSLSGAQPEAVFTQAIEAALQPEG